MDERVLQSHGRTRSTPTSTGSRKVLGSVLVGALLGIALWMGCSDEPVRPSAPVFEPDYFLEDVSASPGQVGVGGSSCTISALVVDRDGLAAAGVAVNFRAEGWGTITEEAVTDTAGTARAVFISGQAEGLARITAHVGAFSRGTVVLIGEGSLSASPAILLANGLETSIVTAQVISGTGRADSGSVVSFNTTAGSITPRGVADAAGIVKATLTTAASVVDLSAVVTARMEDGTPAEDDEPFGITLVTFRGVTLEVEASPATVPADGTSKATVQAVLKETTSRVPIAHESVSFATERGVIVGEAETDERGHAVSDLTSALEAGTTHVVATYGRTLSDTVEVFFSSLDLQGSAVPASVRGDGVSHVEIRAVLKDLGGEPLAARLIEFDTDVGTITASNQTTSSGLATGILTAPASTIDTTAVVRVRGLGVSETVEVPVRGLTLSVVPDPATVTADGSSQSDVTVSLVETTSGAPLASQAIDLRTNLGLVDTLAVTNISGVASAVFHGGASTGTATIRAEYGEGLVSYAQVEVVTSKVASVVLSARPGAIFADGFNSSHVQAFVKDSGNRAVPDGLIVKFYTSGGLITPQSTTVGGVAEALLRSGTEVAADIQVVAVCQGVSDTTYVDFIPGVPATMDLVVSPESIPADGTTTASLVATVQDSIGHSVRDQTLVTFMVIVGLADTAACDTVVVRSTTRDGVASTTYTAATRAGLAIVRATAGEVTAEGTLVLTASGVSSIVLTRNRPSVTVHGVGGVETAMITAEVRDKNGNPVAEGTEVEFRIVTGPGGPLEENLNNQAWGPVAIPTANGRASVTLSSGRRSGVVGIGASCGGVEALDGQITIDSGPADTLMISLNLGLVAECGDGVYNLVVSTLVRDGYGNPVEDGNAVYYDLDASVPHVMIEGNATTGNDIDCNQTWPAPAMKGVARTCLSYTSEAIFDVVDIHAHAFNGANQIQSDLTVGLPLVGGEILISAEPTCVSITNNLALITVSVTDKYDHFIDGAVIDFRTDTNQAACIPSYAVTDENGLCSVVCEVVPDPVNDGIVFAVIARVRNTSLETSVDMKVD